MEISRGFGRGSWFGTWLCPKITTQNLTSAFIHMLSVSLMSMSLVELKWFEIVTVPQQLGFCAPFLSLTQFFSYGYGYTDIDACLTASIVNMMRIIILLAFMVIGFSLCGFYVEVAGSSPGRGQVVQFVRRYALMSTCTVLWVMAVVASCYYVAILLEETFLRLFPALAQDAVVSVTYGCGFYLVAVSGSLNLLGTFLSLLIAHHTGPHVDMSSSSAADDNFLIDGSAAPEAPPPPYSPSPPPYYP